MKTGTLDSKAQSLLKLPVDKMLLYMDPKEKLKKQHSCCVKLGSLYRDIVEFLEEVITPSIFSEKATELYSVFEEERDRHKTLVQQGVESKDTYINIDSYSTRDNFLLGVLYGDAVEGYEYSKPEICWTDDIKDCADDIPYVKELFTANPKTLLETLKFPFRKNNIYFVKQRVIERGEPQTQYYLYLPREVFYG